MSSQRFVASLAIVGLVAGLSMPARAADLTATQASDLQEQLRAWLASLVSPALDVGKQPILVTASGDHFNVVLPAPAMMSDIGVIAPGQSIRLQAKPLDGGRFSLDHLMVPQPLKLTMPAGVIPDAAPDPATGQPTVSPAKSVQYSTASMEFHGLLDPSFATTSSFDSTATGIHTVSSGSDSLTQRSVSHSTWQPTADGHLTVIAEGSADRTAATIVTKDGDTVHYTIAATHSSTRVDAVSPAAIGTLIRSIAALVPTLPGTKDSLDPEQRTLARNAVFALRDMFGGAQSSVAVEGIALTASGHSGSIAKAGIASKMGVDDGKLQVVTKISVEGLDSPEVPAGVYRDYLPRKFSFSPRVSGIPSDDLIKLLLRAIDSDQNDLADLQEQAIALLGAGPLEIGIDDLALDLGRASLAGHGTVDIASPTDITGDAQISVDGLDALIKTANTTPPLKQAAPVLIFLKGIGRQDGGKTVWDIKYEDNKMTVNDTDLSSLMPQK